MKNIKNFVFGGFIVFIIWLIYLVFFKKMTIPNALKTIKTKLKEIKEDTFRKPNSEAGIIASLKSEKNKDPNSNWGNGGGTSTILKGYVSN